MALFCVHYWVCLRFDVLFSCFFLNDVHGVIKFHVRVNYAHHGGFRIACEGKVQDREPYKLVSHGSIIISELELVITGLAYNQRKGDKASPFLLVTLHTSADTRKMKVKYARGQ